MTTHFLTDGHCDLGEIPCHEPGEFRAAVIAACKNGNRLVALPVVEDSGRRLVAVLAHDPTHGVRVLAMTMPADGHYPALTSELTTRMVRKPKRLSTVPTAIFMLMGLSNVTLSIAQGYDRFDLAQIYLSHGQLALHLLARFD